MQKFITQYPLINGKFWSQSKFGNKNQQGSWLLKIQEYLTDLPQFKINYGKKHVEVFIQCTDVVIYFEMYQKIKWIAKLKGRTDEENIDKVQ